MLDRLNALLEPKGVLHVTERGVIDGEIPTIRPHPDFRLFLAMDPKHGEISRAMRNRGIEIFLPNEEDTGFVDGYSTRDVKTLMQATGLVGRLPCEVLLELRKELNGLVPVSSKFNFYYLIGCRILTVV